MPLQIAFTPRMTALIEDILRLKSHVGARPSEYAENYKILCIQLCEHLVMALEADLKRQQPSATTPATE